MAKKVVEGPTEVSSRTSDAGPEGCPAAASSEFNVRGFGTPDRLMDVECVSN